MEGIVKFSNPDNKFGFIKCNLDGLETDVYFGQWSLKDPAYFPRVGENVKFKLLQGAKGWKAADVEII